MAELGTEGSIDGNKRLVIRGKFVPKVCVCIYTYKYIYVYICIWIYKYIYICMGP
jgi:translation initiation factor 2 subunit 2